MECLRISVLVLVSICVIPRRSDAFFLRFPRKLADADQMMPPSPSPANQDSGNAQSPVNVGPPELEAYCGSIPDRCDIEKYTITACVPYLVDGSQASYVLVRNGGESSQKLNIVVSPVNITLEDIIVSRQEIKKVELPPNTESNSSVFLNVGDSQCLIQMGSLLSPETSYADYITPINSTCLFFLAALSIGGTWACCKLAQRKRHLDGIPYQELEMEKQQESDPSFVIETSDGWDQDWDEDDNWGEEKADRSRGSDGDDSKGNQSSLKYVDTTTQWGNDWDD